MEKNLGIPEFYEGRSILLTGATGFFGKLMIEQLLRCTNVGTIYVLVRSKKGKDIFERMEEIKHNTVFDKVREMKDQVFETKVVPIEADVKQVDLGLSFEDRKLITENVSIIIHTAASVRFNDPLKMAVFVNLRSAREMCKLAMETKQLVVYAHISTAYVNLERLHAEEILYPPPFDWKKMIEIAETLDEVTICALTRKVLENFPNTYAFTKNLAEHCVSELCEGKVPFLILRPTIVMSTMKDPIAGWCDNLNGPQGLSVAVYSGVLRVMSMHSEAKMDHIPVDCVIKSSLVAIYDIVTNKSKTSDIVHISAYHIDWLKQAAKEYLLYAEEAEELPLNRSLWTISVYNTKCYYDWYFWTILTQVLPAIAIDLLMVAFGHKPMLKKIQVTLFNAQLQLKYFMENQWEFVNYKVLNMWHSIPKKDMADWDYDFNHFEHDIYSRNAIMGCRRYILNESDEDLPLARIKHQRLKIADKILRTIFYAVTLWFFIRFVFSKIVDEDV